MTPQRIQLRRTKGWRIPANSVVVSRPSKWGNPYVVTRGQGSFWTHDSRVKDRFCDAAPNIELARKLAWGRFKHELIDGRLPFTIEDVRRELKGRNLACWCKLPEPGQPDHCHAALLLEVANA